MPCTVSRVLQIITNLILWLAKESYHEWLWHFTNFTGGSERHRDLPRDKQLRFELRQFGGQSPRCGSLYDAAAHTKARWPLRQEVPAHSLLTYQCEGITHVTVLFSAVRGNPPGAHSLAWASGCSWELCCTQDGGLLRITLKGLHVLMVRFYIHVFKAFSPQCHFPFSNNTLNSISITWTSGTIMPFWVSLQLMQSYDTSLMPSRSLITK